MKTKVFLLSLIVLLSFSDLVAQKKVCLISSGQHTKMKIVAAKAGLKLDHISAYKTSEDLSQYTDFIILHRWGTVQSTWESKIYSKIKSGSKAVILIADMGGSYFDNIYSPFIDLFNVGVAAESVIKPKANVVFNGEVYWDNWDGLKVGCPDYCQIASYLEPINESAKCIGSGFGSQTSGSKRCLSVEAKVGEGIVLIFIMPAPPRGSAGTTVNQTIIDDAQIDALDNKIAVQKIFEWMKY